MFTHDGKTINTLTRAELVANIPTETVTAFDPYYGKTKSFRAMPLKKVLDLGFKDSGLSLDKEEYVLRAKDGYTVPFRASLLLEDGAYVAIEDLEVAGWEPIGNQRANPGPFYLVWSKPDQQSLDTHPRPWQLATIEIAPFYKAFPHTSPGALAVDSPVLAGYAIFRDQCVQCHAINREGGRVGPDLNVPKNILEYRPEAQIKAYIKNPQSFRYGNMPPHPGLSETDLDALIAYFDAMKDRKNDPDAKDGGP